MFAKHGTGLIGLLGFTILLSSAPARAQILQDGDLVIAANGIDGGNNLYGRIFRLRGQTLSLLFQSGQNDIGFGLPSDILLDSQGRIVFVTPGCGGNSNSSAITRYDPTTGVLSQVLCIPYSVGPGGPPPGFPPDATSFYGLNGLHLSRTLKVVIDDDIDGGTPQVSFAEAYGFSIGVTHVEPPGPYNQYQPESFRYVVDDGRVEPGAKILLEPGGYNPGADMFAATGATYYSLGNRIGRAMPDLSIDIRARTTIGGVPASVQGNLRVAAKNEIIIGPGVIDNTVIPNGSATCTIDGQQVTDTNVPYEGSGFHVLDSIRAIGVLDGGLFATSSSTASGFPWLFNLAARDPFLNPNVCAYYDCWQHDGPYNFFQDPPMLAYTTVDHGRVLGGDDNGGRVWSISPSEFHVLSADPQLIRPRGVAAYPPATPPLTAGAMVIRVDSPLNVLLTEPSGRRIGYAADGEVVNDFGESGAVLALEPEGHPRVYALISPPTGSYGVQAVGTGDGPYTIRSYLAETSTGGTVLTRTGQAQTDVMEDLSLHIQTPLAQAWLRLGDLNCDDSIDANDVDPFVQALLDPAGYAAIYPSCELYNADMNRDSQVTGGDIQPFMTKMIQG